MPIEQQPHSDVRNRFRNPSGSMHWRTLWPVDAAHKAHLAARYGSPLSAHSRQSALAIRYLGTTLGGRPFRPWQCLYLSPDPHRQRSLRPTFGAVSRFWAASFDANSRRCAVI